MIEKYAIDPELIPPTDDQIRTLRQLGETSMPKTASFAEEKIKELEEENNEI